MADHFISVNRGANVLQSANFTTGTSSASTDDFELRILDGAGLTKLEVQNLLEALKDWFDDQALVKAAGFDII